MSCEFQKQIIDDIPYHRRLIIYCKEHGKIGELKFNFLLDVPSPLLVERLVSNILEQHTQELEKHIQPTLPTYLL